MDFKKYAKIIMTIETWGDKPKSQIDNSTVDEEIDLKINEHLADPDAHLEVGESLQSHKASGIIDHLARSIVLDKLADFGRERYSLSLESLDAWDITAGVWLNLGEINIFTGNVINQERTAVARAGTYPLWTKFFEWQVIFKGLDITDQIFYIMCGSIFYNEPEDQGVGFKVVDGTLYACLRYSDTEDDFEQVVEIEDIDTTIFHVYYVAFYPANRVEFYIDDVLVATMTENLPDSNIAGGAMFNLYLKNTAAQDKEFYVRQLFFSQAL